jgi:hypothetical protein
MRLYRIDGEKEFIEYKKKEFDEEHRERTLESWLESNPDSIVEDGRLSIIGRQVATNFVSFIDLLALDRTGNVVILELKRDKTPRETIAQALEYASFAEGLGHQELQKILQDYTGDESADLVEYHRRIHGIEQDEPVSFNKDQRIVIVGHEITPEIRQTALFLRSKRLGITCVEFNYFKTDSGERLISNDIVVGEEPLGKGSVASERGKVIDKFTFLESCDAAGRPVFEAILALAELHHLPIHWGTMGFSLNTVVNGNDVSLCKGFRPSSVFGQSIYTTFNQIPQKVENSPALLIAEQRGKFEKSGLFSPTANEMKLIIQRRLSDDEIKLLTKLLLELSDDVKKFGASQD